MKPFVKTINVDHKLTLTSLQLTGPKILTTLTWRRSYINECVLRGGRSQDEEHGISYYN